jgi:CheY-like chemotaxis protein
MCFDLFCFVLWLLTVPQMPIVDGLTSTKMIRSHEKVHPGGQLSLRAAINGRVPIFAVSASLLERERQTYINAGFDGWILKPIDFKRLNVLLLGIVDDQTRSSCLYHAGEWEKGGWFHRNQANLHKAVTVPSKENPVHSPPPKEADQRDSESLGSGSGKTENSEGTLTPTPVKMQRSVIVDERMDASVELGEEDKDKSTTESQTETTTETQAETQTEIQVGVGGDVAGATE